MITTPLSGWLSKLSLNNAFGSSRWQSRYFVLLDSELRYYRDEHSDIASRTISLRDIARVTITTCANQSYCFKLEPTLFYNSQLPTAKSSKRKSWTMACHSEYELDAWVSAINRRLSKLLFTEEDHPLAEMISPTLQPERKRQQPLVSLFRVATSTSTISEASSISNSSVEDVALQPRLKRSNFTISRRRGVVLSLLDMCIVPGLETSGMLSSASSRSSDLPSPVKQATSEEVDEEDETTSQCASKLTAHNAYIMSTSSPNFAIYRERYNL